MLPLDLHAIYVFQRLIEAELKDIEGNMDRLEQLRRKLRSDLDQLDEEDLELKEECSCSRASFSLPANLTRF